MKDELKTAANIRNRCNRNNVERVLRMIVERLKTNPDNSKGLFVFAGIEKGGSEIMEVMQPHLSCSLSFYKCDHRFHTEPLYDLLDKSDQAMYFVLVYGDFFGMYQYSLNHIERLVEKDNRLVKRQRKGGQSSVRFSRLAEESRQYYVSQIQDTIHRVLLEKRLPLVIDGGSELADAVYQELKEPVKMIRTHMFPEHKPGQLSLHKPALNQVLQDIHDTEKQAIAKYCQDFSIHPELYCVGLEELQGNWDNIETVLVLEDDKNWLSQLKTGMDDESASQPQPNTTTDKQVVKVPIGSVYYAFVKSVGGWLAKKYY